MIPFRCYNIFINAGWSSLEARRAHNPKVIGSNPIPAIFLCNEESRRLDFADRHRVLARRGLDEKDGEDIRRISESEKAELLRLEPADMAEFLNMEPAEKII